MPIFGGSQPSHGQTLGEVAFQTSTDFIIELLELDIDDVTREAIEVTNMRVQPTSGDGVGNRIWIPSAYVDPGKLMLQANHDPTLAIPINAPPEEILVKLGPAVSTQEEFDAFGFITKFKITGPLDGKAVTEQIDVKLTDDDSYTTDGATAWTPAS